MFCLDWRTLVDRLGKSAPNCVLLAARAVSIRSLSNRTFGLLSTAASIASRRLRRNSGKESGTAPPGCACAEVPPSNRIAKIIAITSRRFSYIFIRSTFLLAS